MSMIDLMTQNKIKHHLRTVVRAWSFKPPEERIEYYAEKLSNMRLDRLFRTLDRMAEQNKTFPSIAEIREQYYHTPSLLKDQVEECVWCNKSGTLRAKCIDSKDPRFGYEFNFKCRCKNGDALSPSIVVWDKNKYGHKFEYIKD